MSELTTTGVIEEVDLIVVSRMKAEELLQELEAELAVSELQERVNAWRKYLSELKDKEIVSRNKWIETMRASWIESFTSDWVEVKLKTSPGKVIITDESLIPEGFIKTVTKTTTSVDKTRIKKVLKDLEPGEVFEGCHLEQDVTLVIKHL